jgi:hypothetical protein
MPISNRLAQQLVLKTLTRLRSDLAATDPLPPQAHTRVAVLEVALARMVGAVGGQQAENTLWAILGVNERHDFGASLRSQAECKLMETRRASPSRADALRAAASPRDRRLSQ